MSSAIRAQLSISHNMSSRRNSFPISFRGLRPCAALFGFSLVFAFAVGCLADGSVRDEPILPIPAEHGQDPRKVELGRRLFADARLSKDGTISCASCHPLALGGTDRQPRSSGVDGAMGPVNTPTVFNAGFNLAQFWDGRARTLEEQVDGPVHNPIEMSTSWPEVIERLAGDSELRDRFEAVYPEGLSPEAIRDAIATFERTLITPGSAFDRWLLGDDNALSREALKGYRLFKSYGCIACHQGVNIGGNMYQRMGTMGDYFGDRGSALTDEDLGRARVTGDELDRYHFKVPSLRLSALTAPYFHDASVATLDEAIVAMARYQLGRSIPPRHVAAIKSFLLSVVGTHPELPR